MKKKNPRERVSYRALISLVRVAGILRKTGDRFLSAYGITQTQFNVLMVLKYETPKGCSQMKLGQHLLVRPANMTGLVRRMESRGLIARHVVPRDERMWLVRISRKGLELLERVESSYYQKVEQVMEIHSNAELERLSSQMERTEEAVVHLVEGE